MKLTLSLSFVILVVAVAAQQTEWGQCGGIGWTGATTCVSGTTCVTQNDYYAQCLPGTASVSSSSRSSSLASSTSSAPSQPTAPATNANYWFSFGDSYTQTDFDYTSTLPAPGNPLGNPPFPGYTAVGGTNWIDEITVKYNKSLILTYNYAYGGATIDASLVAPYESTVLSMTDQVNEFLNSVATKPASTPWTSADSLFSFWIGINDIGNSYYLGGDRAAFSDTLLDAYFALVEKVVAVGARNFLFINVPPVDRSPMMTAQGTAATSLEASVIAGYNSKLAQRAAALTTNHTDAKTWLWDSNTAFSIVLDDPTAYGFIDNTSYGNTGDFWGNNYHPSSAAQELWAQDVAAVLTNTIW
ncbi:carbohydrate esterase family 16 protein [Phlebiopsis gigantea 11061_1 CR5-6]|uniref:Carbohydrate esterase family 16 protein n=1 Tax=Phlebiopsis gigantea (strain 11061_1 CR5-6) TaxID=745531 RepID=A0A0C3PPT0_PHLG1|nr:carbohydrate esterase family 16 protein [Phlebiopsis gigantea 11061_1 CR5-6]